MGDDGFDGGDEPARDVRDGQRRLALFRRVGHVDESGAGRGAGGRVQHAVHEVVAHEGARGIRQRCGQASVANGGDHGFDRQRREICCGSILDDGRARGLVTRVVWNRRVVDIDSHALRRELGAASGLADTEDGIGTLEVW